MHIGLYFGSFNPIHNGHLIIANHVTQYTDIDKVWFIVSPHNPFKEAQTLLNEYHRLHLVNIAIEDNTKFRASNIEFNMPKPSYTIDTLTYLAEKFPFERFSVILGSDSFQNIHRWKNFEMLVGRYAFVVYNRPGYVVKDTFGASVTTLDAPLLDISSTFIRKQIREKKSIKYLVPDAVDQYIAANRYYAG